MTNPKRIILYFVFFVLFFALGVSAAETASASSLYFSPSSGTYAVGNIFSVNVLVDTKGQAINNAEAVINFPSELLNVISISQAGSIFNLWVEAPNFSNRDGRISFNGGLPTPGYNGSAGKIFSVVFRAVKEGRASVVFVSGAVRANDGFGTDILKLSYEAYFTLAAERPAVTPAPVPVPAPVALPAKPVVSSPTHPNSEIWYSNNAPEFSWELPAGVNGVAFLFDQNPDTNPGTKSEGLITSQKYAKIEDGIWYFHARYHSAAGWGPIAHRKAMIDVTPPELIKAEIYDEGDPTNPFPLLRLEARDLTSGLDYYEIEAGEKGEKIKIMPWELPYRMSYHRPGKYALVVKAVDKAGNSVSVRKDFIIKSLPVFIKFGKIAIDYLTIMTTLIVLLIGLVAVIVYVWHRIAVWRKRVKKETSETEESVRAAFETLRKDVEKQVAQLDGKPDLSEKEKRISDALKNALKVAEKSVSKEIKDIEKEL